LGLTPSLRKLGRILEELNALPKARKQWYQAPLPANGDAQKIKKAIKDMDEAFSNFEVRVCLIGTPYHELSCKQTGLHLLIGTGVEALQSSSTDIHQTLMNHSNDHVQSHSGILQIQKGQQDIRGQLEVIETKQQEEKSQLSEIGALSLLPRMGD
jgi:hypothetical protein